MYYQGEGVLQQQKAFVHVYGNNLLTIFSNAECGRKLIPFQDPSVSNVIFIFCKDLFSNLFPNIMSRLSWTSRCGENVVSTVSVFEPYLVHQSNVSVILHPVRIISF
jgi:hypothetical protein